MENATFNCPSAPNPDDQEVFRRVWKRVMPEEEESCPIEVVSADLGGDLPCACICPTSAVENGDAVPAAMCEVCSPHRGGDFPSSSDIPRLGPSSAVYGSMLQKQVTDALECWQLYRHLAQRAGGGRASRQLSEMASEKHHAARRLAAAHFLISGVRFWPVARLTAPCIPSYLGTIRRAYQAEQQREQAYLLSAADTGDEALSELFQDLAGQSAEHSTLLRTLLEQSQI